MCETICTAPPTGDGQDQGRLGDVPFHGYPAVAFITMPVRISQLGRSAGVVLALEAWCCAACAVTPSDPRLAGTGRSHQPSTRWAIPFVTMIRTRRFAPRLKPARTSGTNWEWWVPDKGLTCSPCPAPDPPKCHLVLSPERVTSPCRAIAGALHSSWDGGCPPRLSGSPSSIGRLDLSLSGQAADEMRVV